ncbi:MAG: hypothetical protein QXI91_06965 [Candidatus Bathyarchaeia archaeon]
MYELRSLAYRDKNIIFLNETEFDIVYNTIRESLGQIDWATRGKTDAQILNETPNFLWELYYLLGLNQWIEQLPPRTKLIGLSDCFDELESYWDQYAREGRVDSSKTPPQTALACAVEKATMLHQELTRWDKYNTIIFLPD